MKAFARAAIVVAGVVIFGLVASLLAESGTLPNPFFTASYQVDLAGLLSRGAIFLGVLLLVFFLILWQVEHTIDARQSEEQKIQAAARQRFFQRLDHELKNPLTIIRLGIVNLQQGPNLDSDQSGTVERISQQVQRLEKLVVDLRLLYELDPTRIELKSVDLKAMLQEVISLSCTASGSSRSVSLDVQDTPWPVSNVRGDRDLLVLVFRNLVDNALKFTTPDDKIEVRVTEDGRMAIVDVSDTGLGILAEEIPHIFEELYRGQNARGIPGSGLGLRLVERIVELHNGVVQVRSKADVGTVFTVKLPLASDAG
jgi:two-component system OmpR family sensor kinase